MTWDPRMLAIGVVEEFATAQELYAWRGADIYHAARAVRERDRLREQRGGLKGYKYNDGRWRGRRPATRYVQLDLPFMEQAIMRERLPADRSGVTQKFTIITRRPDDDGVVEVDLYLTANTYPDDYANAARRGQLGEVLIRIGKAGHTEAIYGEWAKTMSHSLQCGVPVDDLFRKHVGTRFDPHGATTHPMFKRCTSPLDLVSRWILSRYGSAEAKSWIASMQKQPIDDEETQP